jgi:Cu-Zn family superoxide dismutase
MKRTALAAAVITALSISPVFAQTDSIKASATILDADGAEIGKASLIQAPTGVLMHLKVSSLNPGKHGLHLHGHGECDAKTGYKSAKGHVGKSDGGHGLLNPDGPEPGDLPNIFVGADGTGEMEAFSTMVSLTGGDNNLLDEDGSTFIIHENADDHVSQPIGGAGARVACGVIEKD